MAEDVSVGRFFDDPMLMELAAADLANQKAQNQADGLQT